MTGKEYYRKRSTDLHLDNLFNDFWETLEIVDKNNMETEEIIKLLSMYREERDIFLMDSGVNPIFEEAEEVQLGLDRIKARTRGF